MCFPHFLSLPALHPLSTCTTLRLSLPLKILLRSKQETKVVASSSCDIEAPRQKKGPRGRKDGLVMGKPTEVRSKNMEFKAGERNLKLRFCEIEN